MFLNFASKIKSNFKHEWYAKLPGIDDIGARQIGQPMRVEPGCHPHRSRHIDCYTARAHCSNFVPSTMPIEVEPLIGHKFMAHNVENAYNAYNEISITVVRISI